MPGYSSTVPSQSSSMSLAQTSSKLWPCAHDAASCPGPVRISSSGRPGRRSCCPAFESVALRVDQCFRRSCLRCCLRRSPRRLLVARAVARRALAERRHCQRNRGSREAVPVQAASARVGRAGIVMCATAVRHVELELFMAARDEKQTEDGERTHRPLPAHSARADFCRLARPLFWDVHHALRLLVQQPARTRV